MTKYFLGVIDAKITENNQILQHQRSSSGIITVPKGSSLTTYEDNENFV